METNNTAKAMRRELEGWREIIIRLRSILLWEQNYHPMAIFGVVNAFLIMIYVTEPSTLTLLSILGIVLVVSDYIMPQISFRVFGIDNWTGADEKKYEQAVLALHTFFCKFSSIKDYFMDLKKSQPKGFFARSVGGLLLLAWIGMSMNTAFYFLIVNAVFLYPGLQSDKKVQQLLGSVMGSLKKESGSLKKD